MAFKELEEFRFKRGDADERPAILIVEDGADLRMALEIVQRRLYRLRMCASGREGM